MYAVFCIQNRLFKKNTPNTLGLAFWYVASPINGIVHFNKTYIDWPWPSP